MNAGDLAAQLKREQLRLKLPKCPLRIYFFVNVYFCPASAA
jgi:hypothetical protein